jgi:hypothetical protein
MNDAWSDFEKYVFGKLEAIEERIRTLENFRWKLAGGALAVVFLVEVGSQILKLKGMFP